MHDAKHKNLITALHKIINAEYSYNGTIIMFKSALHLNYIHNTFELSCCHGYSCYVLDTSSNGIYALKRLSDPHPHCATWDAITLFSLSVASPGGCMQCHSTAGDHFCFLPC